MAIITPAQTVLLVDHLCGIYNAIRTGVIDARVITTVMAGELSGADDASFADIDLQLGLNPSFKAMHETNLQTNAVFAGIAQGFFAALSSRCGLARSIDATINDIDSFAYYYNVTHGTKNQCLLPADWRSVFYALGASGYQAASGATRYPNPKNLFAVVREGGTFVDGTPTTNGLARYNVGTTTLTTGYTIDYLQYGGGFPWIKWTSGNGSGACVITVTGKDESNTTRTYTLSGTWGTGSFVATQAGVALTPSAANARIVQVTNVAVTGMTAGDIYVEAAEPTGRVYPPA